MDLPIAKYYMRKVAPVPIKNVLKVALLNKTTFLHQLHKHGEKKFTNLY